MKSLYLLFFLTFPVWACDFDMNKAERALDDNVRDLFELDLTTSLRRADNVDQVQVPRNESVAYIQHVMDEKIYAWKKSKISGACPMHFIQINRIFTHDPYRKCNGIMKSDLIKRTHEVIYRYCSANEFRSKDVAL